MTKSEFKKKVAESPNSEFLSKLDCTITFNKIGSPISFKSVVDLYDFIFDQIAGWSKFNNINSEISNISYFEQFRDFLEKEIDKYFKDFKEVNQHNYWIQNTLSPRINNIASNCSDFNHTYSRLICNISENNNGEFALGAFKYFNGVGSVSSLSLPQLKGFLIANEFDIANKLGLITRTKKEIQGINEVNKKYNALVTELNKLHVDHLAVTNADLKVHIEGAAKFKEEKEGIFNTWFGDTKTIQDTFFKDSNDKIEALEELYEKKLQLQAPAKYWDKKSKEYLRQAELSRNILTIVIGLFGGLFAAILIISPDWIFESVFKGNSISIIRWSVVFIALVSLLAFVIRAITKIMFSAFHLARDAEERHTLTFFYLALLNDPKSEIKEEERKMIIQSLFSRVDTGLLKGDASPEMPNDFLSKILGRSNQ